MPQINEHFDSYDLYFPEYLTNMHQTSNVELYLLRG